MNGVIAINTNSAENDRSAFRQLTTDSLANNQRLWFGADDRETKRNDPRCQSEDLGNNAMQASMYGIKNLQRILPNLEEWTKQEGGSYETLSTMYAAIKDQYYRYMQHVMMNLGGLYTTPKTRSDKGVVVEPTPAALHKEAITFFHNELFTTPYWILEPKIRTLVQEQDKPDFVQDLQIQAMNKLLDIKKLNQLLANQQQFADKALSLE